MRKPPELVSDVVGVQVYDIADKCSFLGQPDRSDEFPFNGE
jgi:hypothetical protein